jgi:hypothetical protein
MASDAAASQESTMSTILGVSAEELARVFHYYHEALAHDFEPSSSETGAWQKAPEKERTLMVAAARLTLQELGTTTEPSKPGRKYFATPGEADWGC